MHLVTFLTDGFVDSIYFRQTSGLRFDDALFGLVHFGVFTDLATDVFKFSFIAVSISACFDGKVNEFTFDEIRSFTYKNGSNFWKMRDVKIPTLDEFLDVFVGSNTRPQIEIKAETYDLLYTVIDAVVAKGLEESAIIISFDLEQLKRIHEINSNIELWYLIDRIEQKHIDEAKAIGDNVWLSPCFDKNDKQSIQLAVDNKIGVSFWTVNTIKDAKMLYEMGVRFYETDILCN
jgi:glycerophosphoryl diester phosphodiesterase